MIQPRYLTAILLAALAWPAAHAAADVVTYVVDPTQSSLTITGTYEGNALQPQQGSPGSLTTSFSGTITADLSNDSIQIMGGKVNALTNDSVSPTTGLPADFGFGASADGSTFTGTLSEFALDPTSAPLAPLPEFDVSQIQFNVSSGNLDYSSKGGAGGGGGSGSVASTGALAPTLTSGSGTPNVLRNYLNTPLLADSL